MRDKSVKVRLMTMGDYYNVCDFWRSLGEEEANENNKELLAAMAKILIRNPRTCFVAIYDGKIVGTLLAKEKRGRGCIYHYASVPTGDIDENGSEDSAESDVTAALLSTAFRAFKAKGIENVVMELPDENDEDE